MVFQLLFSIDMGDNSERDLIPFFMRELTISHKHVRQAYQKAQKIWEKRSFLDQKIENVLHSCPMDRISYVEKNILRLALWEMLVEKEVAPKIAITESIRLCRKFSTPSGGAFVNAILDAYYSQGMNDEKLGPTLSPSEKQASR